MGRALVAALAVFAACASLGGCGERAHDVTTEAVLSPISYALWQDHLKAYSPDIVVVDYWATWCTPCVERFPKMIELSERYRDRGVRFVSMSLEDRDDAAAVAGAARFLESQRPAFDNFLLDEPLLEGFEKLGLRGVPAVHVYDRTGALSNRLTGENPADQFDEADVEAAIVALLAQ